MQQNIINIIIASIIGFFLSLYCMLKEIRFVSIMREFDQDITWLVQVPLMVFIVLLILLCTMLFIGSFGSFSVSAFKKEVPWKKLLISIFIFDAVILVFAFINIYFELATNLIAQIVVLVTLVVFYIYSVVKYKINPIFFLVSLCIVSSIVLYIVFGMD